MELLSKLLHLIRDPGPLIVWGGYPGLALIIFLETGAMVFFLPGDSLLVTAGIYANQGSLSLLTLNLILIPCAILGDACSYWMGAKMGPRIFNRPRSRLFRPEHVQAAHAFYEKHGGKAIIIARFMPLVRTFVPVVAGVARMPYRRFAMYNIVGGASWVLSMTLIGYFLVELFKRVFHVELDRHLEKVIILVVLASITPGLIEWYRARRRARLAKPAASE
ncbi:MAG: DedA family protein [Myxococcales bacterium]|nr:DedA family protein [Myxococcales bacterium]